MSYITKRKSMTKLQVLLMIVRMVPGDSRFTVKRGQKR